MSHQYMAGHHRLGYYVTLVIITTGALFYFRTGPFLGPSRNELVEESWNVEVEAEPEPKSSQERWNVAVERHSQEHHEPGLPELNPLDPYNFSSLSCPGNGDRCHFKNICVQNSKVYFYLQTLSEHVSIHNRSFLFEEPGGFLSAHPVLSFRDAHNQGTRLSVEVIKSPIPPSATRTTEYVTVFAESGWWGNLGHFILDGTYPLFSLMSNFNMVRRDMRFVSFPGSGACFHFPSGITEPVERIASGIFSSLTSTPSTCLADYSELTCFKNVLVGTGFEGMMPQIGEASALTRRFGDFRNFIASSSSIDLPVESLPSSRQRITKKTIRVTWLSKVEVRRVHNSGDIIQRLTDEQAARGIKIECREVYWENVTTFRERVVILDSTDILISMYGTAAVFSVFLRKGAVFLVIGAGRNLGNEMPTTFSQYTDVILVEYTPEGYTDIIPPPDERTAEWPDFGLNLTYSDFRPFFLRALNEVGDQNDPSRKLTSAKQLSASLG